MKTKKLIRAALIGIGIWNDKTEWRMISGILTAWLATLPMAAAIAGTTALILGG